MLTALSVLPLLALSGHVTIDDVSASAAANKVTVEVKTSSPVETGDVRSKFAQGMMQLYLDGGAAGAKRAIKSGGLGIAVLKRAGYAKIEVPLAADLGCTGPVRIEAVEGGFKASLNCQGASAPAAEEAPAPTEEKPAAVAATTKAAEPAPKAEAQPEPKAEVKAEPKTEAKAADEKPAAEKKPEPAKAAAPAPTAPITTAQMPKSSSSGAMMLPAFALIVIGGAAWFLKRRQGKKSSMIEILETAQLGPKRQLVVARVNGETMILGSSEAGITCLSGLHRLPPMGSEGTMSSIFQVSQMNQMQMANMNQLNQMGQLVQPPAPVAAPQQFPEFEPAPVARGPIAEFQDEGGILTRLFRAKGQDKPQEKFDNIELHEFDSLLQESVADQELRRKLSSGFRGKVS
jgi:flagellar biogenesis protein FliO